MTEIYQQVNVNLHGILFSVGIVTKLYSLNSQNIHSSLPVSISLIPLAYIRIMFLSCVSIGFLLQVQLNTAESHYGGLPVSFFGKLHSHAHMREISASSNPLGKNGQTAAKFNWFLGLIMQIRKLKVLKLLSEWRICTQFSWLWIWCEHIQYFHNAAVLCKWYVTAQKDSKMFSPVHLMCTEIVKRLSP